MLVLEVWVGWLSSSGRQVQTSKHMDDANSKTHNTKEQM